MPAQQVRMGVYQTLLAYLPGLCSFETGDSHNPSMEFHSSTVAFLYGKSQRIVSGILVIFSGQRHIPRFNLTGINHTSTDTGLKEHRIYTALLHLVKQTAQFFLLFFTAVRTKRLGLGPVQTTQCSKPNPTHFVFGRRVLHQIAQLCFASEHNHQSHP